jgi:hypothetical protein
MQLERANCYMKSAHSIQASLFPPFARHLAVRDPSTVQVRKLEVSPRRVQVEFKLQKYEYLQAVVVDHRRHWGWAVNHGSLKMWKMDGVPPLSCGGCSNSKWERCKEPSTLVFLPVRRLYQPLSTHRLCPVCPSTSPWAHRLPWSILRRRFPQ